MDNRKWLVIYTKPKNELKVSNRLSEMGVECYCPTFKSMRQWSDRKKKITMPLFRSYVFVKINPEKRELVYSVNGVVRYLFWLGKPAIVKNEEIEAIKDFLSESNSIEHPSGDLAFGQSMNIRQGPFKGMTGKYLYRKKNQLILEVPTLGTVVKISLHKSQLA